MDIKILQKIIFMVSIIFVITACQVSTPIREDTTQKIEQEDTPTKTPTSSPDENPIRQSILLINAPELYPGSLIKLDVITGNLAFINVPADTGLPNLKQQISPDRTMLVLEKKNPGEVGELQIFNLSNETIRAVFPLHSASGINFDAVIHKMPDEIRTILQENNISGWAFKESYLLSQGRSWWCQNPDRLYFSDGNNSGNTNLHVFDPVNNTISQLESLPFMVSSLSCSPDGSQVFLRKNALINFSHPLLESWYVINKDGEVSPVPIPDQYTNNYWSIYWAGKESLWTVPIDHNSFTNLGLLKYFPQTSEYKQIFKNSFQDFLEINSVMVFLSTNDNNESKISIILNGDRIIETVVPDKCQKLVYQATNEDLIIDCTNTWYSYNLTNQLIQKIVQPQIILISPDENWKIIFSIQNHVSENDVLELINLNNSKFLSLNFDPIREVIWTPDSQSFLTVTNSGIYRSFVSQAEPELIFKFQQNDYRNLDAVWILN